MEDKDFKRNFRDTGTEISKYIKILLDTYRKDTGNKPIVLEELKAIFLNEDYRAKILDGNEFIIIFKEKIRKKRIKNLMMFLMDIDPDRYSNINFQW